MQREEDGGIVISCDFCGTDWDEVRPMIEGHKGSILCLECFKHALAEAQPAEAKFECTLCLMRRDPGVRQWTPPPAPARNPDAEVCWDCVRQAAKAYHKDKDVDFRWDPSEHPKE